MSKDKMEGRVNMDFHKSIIESFPVGYAYHKIILDENNRPFDYEFIEVNIAFENLTGLKRSDILGKNISEVLPDIKKSEFNWIKFYGNIAINGGSEEFEQFSEPLKRWYKVKAYSLGKGTFITAFTDITIERNRIKDFDKLSVMSEDLLQGFGEDSDYQKITDDFLEITNAKFANFNLYDEDGKQYTTMAIAGDRGILNKAMSIMGMKLERKKWIHDPVRADKIKDKMVTHFPTLHDLAGDVIPKAVCDLLTKSFGLGETVLVKILKNNIMLGDFTLIMPRGKAFDKDSIAEIFSRQLGLALSRMRAEATSREAEWKFKALFEQGPIGVAYHKMIYDNAGKAVDYFFIDANHNYEKLTGVNPRGMRVTEAFPGIEQDPFDWIGTFDEVARSGKTIHFEQHLEAVDEWYDCVAYQFRPGYFVATFLNTTERKKAELELRIKSEKLELKNEEIKYLSFHDYLTGLYNRRFFEAEMERLDTERNLPITIVMGDVNGLKLINDSLGHSVGDELLIKTAETLKKSFRSDDIIARVGGDEYVILLPKTDVLEAKELINRLKRNLKNDRVRDLEVSVSFGWGTKTDVTESIALVLKEAEDHMYNNKLFEGPSARGKVIENIMETINAKNPREEAHSERVSHLCVVIGEALEIDEKDIIKLKALGLFHDIGKIAIADDILNKPEKLTEKEYNEIKRHSEIGYRILSTVNDMSEMAKYVMHHHERWDGKGYPKGLKGDSIPRFSRICALADAYDAMTSDRSYRPAMTNEFAVEELQKNSGTQFDSEIVDVFVEKVLPTLNNG